MAEEKTKDTNEEASPEKKSNVLMIVIIGVLVLIIVIGAVLAIVLMGDDEEQMVSNVAPATKEAGPQKRRANTALAGSRRLSEIGILYPLDSFTVNLKSDAGRRYLKATISLELSGEEVSLELDAKSPVIRDRVIRILTSKTLEEISSKKGKQKVSDQIQDTLNAIITDGHVQGIYFTEFVIQ